MSGSASFRATVQPLVRSAAMRGASVAEITNELRVAYGHAYRRTDLLADMRAYRATSSTIASVAASTASAAAASASVAASAVVASAMSSYRDLRGIIARVGVAAFSVSLLLPSVVHTSASAPVMIASSLDQHTAYVEERVALPNERPVRLVATSRGGGPGSASEANAPTPEAAPAPTAAPTPAPPPPPIYASLPNGLTGVVVTASWYGPGFYDNRLPCWQWLQAHGLPIQYEADTWGVAHKTLPCGTMLTLSHGTNIITVPVVDRGPYVAGRELDLSPRVKAALGCTDLCTVVMHIP